MLDVLVVGGGPAGLSAALMLGRCRRSVLVIEAGSPRNARSRALHGFLSRDGIRPAELLRIAREDLARYGVEVRAACATDAARTGDVFTVSLDRNAHEPIARLRHAEGGLREIVFRAGDSLACRALFFNTGQYTRSPLAERLGCRFTARGAVRTNDLGETHVAGLYAAGDASRDVQFAVVAAAEGAKVAYAINVALRKVSGER